jgi:hypothetical protein
MSTSNALPEVRHWIKFWIVSENELVAMAATLPAARIAAMEMSKAKPRTVYIAIARGIGNRQDEYSCWMDGKEI